MDSYSHRVGKFSIPLHEIQRQGLRLLPLFARVVVVDCHYDFAKGTYDYMALSPDFDMVPMGQPSPEYEWIITINSASEITRIEARRMGGGS